MLDSSLKLLKMPCTSWCKLCKWTNLFLIGHITTSSVHFRRPDDCSVVLLIDNCMWTTLNLSLWIIVCILMVIVFFSFFSLCWIYIFTLVCHNTQTVIIPSVVIVDSPRAPRCIKKYAIMCLAARQDSAQGWHSFILYVCFLYTVWPKYNVSLHELPFLQEPIVLMCVTGLSMGISYSTFWMLFLVS